MLHFQVLLEEDRPTEAGNFCGQYLLRKAVPDQFSCAIMLLLLARSERRGLMLQIAEASIKGESSGKPYFTALDNEVINQVRAEKIAGDFLKQVVLHKDVFLADRASIG